MIRLLFTTGRGPHECRIALAKALAAFAREAEAAGVELDLATGAIPTAWGRHRPSHASSGMARRRWRRGGSAPSCGWRAAP